LGFSAGGKTKFKDFKHKSPYEEAVNRRTVKNRKEEKGWGIRGENSLKRREIWGEFPGAVLP